MNPTRPTVIEPLRQAFDYMGHVLFRPFCMRKWWMWGALAFFGGLHANGNFNYHFNSNSPLNRNPALNNVSFDVIFQKVLQWLSHHWVVIGIITGVLVLLGLIWVYVCSRMKIVFVDQVSTNETQFRKSWREHRTLGHSLFFWEMGLNFLLLLILVLGFVHIWPILYQNGHFQPFSRVFSTMIVVFLVFGLVLIALFLVSVYLYSFVAPLMWARRIRVLDAWGVFLKHFRSYPGLFLLYLPILLGIAIIAGIVGVLVCCFTCCLAMIPVVGTTFMLPIHVLIRMYPVFILAQIDGPVADALCAAHPMEPAQMDAPTPPSAWPPRKDAPADPSSTNPTDHLV